MSIANRLILLMSGLSLIVPVHPGQAEDGPETQAPADQTAAPAPIVNANFTVNYWDSRHSAGATVRFIGHDYSGIPIAPVVVQTDSSGSGTAPLVARPTQYTIIAHGEDDTSGWAATAIAPKSTVQFGITLQNPYDSWSPQYWRYAVYEGFGMHLNPFTTTNPRVRGPWDGHLQRLRLRRRAPIPKAKIPARAPKVVQARIKPPLAPHK